MTRHDSPFSEVGPNGEDHDAGEGFADLSAQMDARITEMVELEARCELLLGLVRRSRDHIDAAGDFYARPMDLLEALDAALRDAA